MTKRIKEETILFLTVIKWVFLSIVVGMIVGGGTVVFLKSLNWAIAAAGRFWYAFLFLPLIFFLSSLIVTHLAPDAKGHGTEKVIEAIHKKNGHINIMVVPVKLLATVITIAFGGSAGKEGPCAQIGAGLASFFADIFRFDDFDRRKLVICGISAGFAAVFGTPIAGAIFGVEVLFVGSVMYDVLLPSFIAGIVGYHTASALGIIYAFYPINIIPDFGAQFFLEVLLSGAFFGIISFLLIEILSAGEDLAARIRWYSPFKGLLGGGVLALLAVIFSQQYLGLGLDTVKSSLTGGEMFWYTPVLKMIFTSVTLAFGGSGGIITPIFFVGASSGSFFGSLLHLDPVVFAAIGFVAVLAGAANTPIAASIMAVEMFGPSIAPYAALACVVSFIMTGHRSVYSSQILAFKKSKLLDVSLGGEIDKVDVRFKE